jgi:hypothetical protein
MGKRSCTSNPAVVELGHEDDVALRSSKRRALQGAFDTAAMSLMSLRTKLPTALSEVALPLNKSRFPLQPHPQAKAMKYLASTITDDEDENEKNKVVASKKRPYVGHSLTQMALRKPILSIVGTRNFEGPNHRKLPLGKPLPPPPMLHLLLSRKVINEQS